MNLTLFCTAFILQFVGHRMGDYLFQTDWQAQNKAKNGIARLKHCSVYSLVISALLLMIISWQAATIVFWITFFEHVIIDSRDPIIWWKTTLERVVGNKSFEMDKMPFFVLIEIDQTVHYMRCLIIALLIGYGMV